MLAGGLVSTARAPRTACMKTILLVDDSATIRNLIRVYLMGMDFHFLEADRGESGLSIVSSEAVDLVVVDVNMPGMDGLTFVRKVRTMPSARRVPVVLLTSDKSSDTRARGMAAGANDFVLKPVTSSSLRETVCRLLGVEQT
jgi:CheY-like chemotaxis protein